MYRELLNKFKLLLIDNDLTLKDIVKMYNATVSIEYQYKYATVNAAINSGSLRVATLLNLLEVLNYKLIIADINDKPFKPYSVEIRYL